MSSCEIHFWYILGLCLCCRTLVVVISQYRYRHGTFSVYLLCHAQMFTKTPIMLCFPTYYAWHYAVHLSPPRNSHCMYLCVHNANYNIRTYINPIMLTLWFTDKFEICLFCPKNVTKYGHAYRNRHSTSGLLAHAYTMALWVITPIWMYCMMTSQSVTVVNVRTNYTVL